MRLCGNAIAKPIRIPRIAPEPCAIFPTAHTLATVAGTADWVHAVAGSILHPSSNPVTDFWRRNLDPALNPFAWTAETLQPNGTEPGPNTIASDGPTQGGLLLFKVNDSVYSNRPLTLYVLGAGNRKLGSISLNL